MTFSNLSADQTNQNFTAVLVGDVSGNWTPPAGTAKAGQVTINATIPVSLPQNPAFDASNTLSSGLSINANVPSPGHLVINAFSSNNPLSGQGVLLNLKFNVVGASGAQTALTWGSFHFNEGTASDPQPNLINGQFTAIGPSAADSTISRQVTTAAGEPLAGVVMQLNGAAQARAITDAAGRYRFENVESGGFYTVRPARANYQFAPGERSFSLNADKTDALFTATREASTSDSRKSTSSPCGTSASNMRWLLLYHQRRISTAVRLCPNSHERGVSAVER